MKDKMEVIIAVMAEKFNLNIEEFSSMLEILGYVTHEQCEIVCAICSAFKMREVIENQMKHVKFESKN